MKTYPKSLGKLIYELSKLPGVGSKSAQRLAFYLLSRPREEVLELSKSLIYAKDKMKLCKRCFHITEEDYCDICTGNRDQSVICVVEDPRDVIAMEKSGGYQGLYHVLHGSISPMDGVGPDDIKIKELLLRLKEEPDVKEIILAVGSDVEGETTALYLSKLLKPIVKVTRLAAGIPVGGDLEYADEITLMRAIEGRREF